MFQVAPSVVILGYAAIAIFGFFVGLLSGILFSRILKLGAEGIVKDAFLGAIGSVFTVIGCAVIPWSSNTVFQSLGPNVRLETTVNRFQHPYIAATIVAVIFPALHQLVRFRRLRSGRK